MSARVFKYHIYLDSEIVIETIRKSASEHIKKGKSFLSYNGMSKMRPLRGLNLGRRAFYIKGNFEKMR